MNDSRTLIIVSPGFAADETDSTCLPAQQLFVRALNRQFPSLSIIIIALQYPYHNREYTWFGNRIIPMNGKRSLKAFRILSWFETYRILKAITKNEKPVGILSFWCLETALIGNFFAMRKNLTHKVWILGQDARKQNKFVRWIKPDKRSLVAVSDFVRDKFESNHHVLPANVVPNGIDETMFSKEDVEKDIHILGVGSLIPLKQYSIFVDVVARLAKSHPRLKAVLIGDGPDKKILQDQINERGLSSVIHMTGELPHSIALRWMERSKILLHPSSYEGYSTVCLEALFAGCEVISFTFAEKRQIHRWHIVRNVDEMTSLASRYLVDPPSVERIKVHRMSESASQMMRLFNHSE